MHHIMGLLSQVIVPAVNGTQSVTMPTEQFQKRPLGWLQLISTYRGTHSAAGNFAFDLVTRLVTDEQIGELDLRSLKGGLFCGSEPIRPETMRAFIDKFAPAGITEKVVATSMGMTETGDDHGQVPPPGRARHPPLRPRGPRGRPAGALRRRGQRGVGLVRPP